jgi:PAS domain S-box-containing protein
VPSPRDHPLPPLAPPGSDRDLFRLLVESVQEYAIFVLDPAGRVASWNRGAERIKGYAAPEIIGRHFSIFYPPEDVKAGKPAREIETATATGSFQEEGWRVRKDGSRFLASVVLTALRSDDGRLAGFAKITRDMTERRRADESRRSLLLAREALQTRDAFLAVASHELRTPLTSLQLVIQALARHTTPGVPVTPQMAERVSQADRLLSRLSGLVSGMLDVAAVAGGELSLARSTFDLAGLVVEVTGAFDPEAKRRGGRIDLDTREEVVGSWDRGRLAQAIAAVVGNAVKYAGGAPISVSVSAIGDRAEVAVEDHGPGIPDEDQARVFERFEKAVPVQNYGGFGVGLWMARQIVAAHGGDIALRSAPARGARFALLLPRDPPGGAHGS